MLDETLGSEELALWFARFGALLGFGSPILDTLDALNGAVADPELRAANDALRRSLAAGGTVSSAMALRPDIWPAGVRFLVGVGELGGVLDYIASDIARCLAAGPPATSERALFCLALGRLLEAQVPLARALSAASGALYRPAADAVCALAQQLDHQDGSLVDALGQAMALDPITRQLLRVGESSDRLGAAALRAAQLLEVEARQGPTS